MHRSRASICGIALLSLALLSGCGALKRFAYAGPGRDETQQPERVVAALALEPGARVADIGAGGGYFTFRFADAVGPAGLVYAVDIDPDMLEYLRTRVGSEQRANIEVVEAAADDSRLPAASVDLIFVCNTYHHLSDRVAYFDALRARLRPDGRVAIIDYQEGKHGTNPAVIRTELTDAGYRLLKEETFLEEQSFLIFTPSP
ncbi:MAG: class I SAM-dependent methyltransferase [Myxococcota bacterium]